MYIIIIVTVNFVDAWRARSSALLLLHSLYTSMVMATTHQDRIVYMK